MYRFPKHQNILLTHKKGTHYKMNECKNEESTFKCDRCELKFWKEESLNQHKRIHSDQKIYECEICKSKYYRVEDLEHHKLVHLPVVPKSFPREVTLPRPSPRRQLKRKIYHCVECNETFNVYLKYIHHKRKHPYFKDPICDKQFKQIEKLKFRTLYKCSSCKLTFNALDDCKRHKTNCFNVKEKIKEEVEVEIKKDIIKEEMALVKLIGNLKFRTLYKCSHCKLTFDSLFNCKMHRIDCLKSKQEIKAEKKEETKEVIKKKIPIFRKIKKPQQVRTLYKCSYCKLTYDTLFDCRKHRIDCLKQAIKEEVPIDIYDVID